MKRLLFTALALMFLITSCENEPIAQDSRWASYQYNSSASNTLSEEFIIDFENYNAGDIVSEITIADPFSNIEVAGITMAFPGSNAAMVFDSSNPTGGDFDIGTPNEMYGGPGRGDGGASNDTAMGNVLILSEDLDSSDPDDIFEVGASFFFDFSANEAVTLNYFDILDIEESSNPTVVNLYDANGVLLLGKQITPGGDNSKTRVDLEKTSNVAFMEIIMNSSGAIDNISFDLQTEEFCAECDSAIVELNFRYIGFSPNASIRIETPDGTILFDGTVQSEEVFTVTGSNPDGTFGESIRIFVNGQQVDELTTDCSSVIGPGIFIEELDLESGRTESGALLCPISVG